MPDVFVAPEDTEDITVSSSPKPKHPAPRAVKKDTAKQKLSAFSSFCHFPDGVSFEHQEKGEEIVLFLRRHFITNLSWIIGTVIFSLLPLIVFVLLASTGLDIQIPQRYVIILTSFYYLIIFGFALTQFVIWFYNVGIVTPLRVIDVDISHITAKNVAATGISDIVDVEYSQKGLLSNFFNYGDVQMQTEGLKANFEFHSIPHPAKAADTISDLMGGRELNE